MSTTTATPAPADMQPPYRIAPDTWVISEIVQGEPGTFVPLNSMVIAGAEPVIVDTGNELSRREWLDAAFSIVDPADVRWVFLSHDDHDHIGNLLPVLEACPRATLVTTHFTVERVMRAMHLPLDRMRWVNPGESFDAGDRTLVTMRPPVFDGPTTRGLFDPTTGVCWAVDSFASLVTGHLTDADDVPRDLWEESMLLFGRMVSPWHAMLDAAKFDAQIDALARLGITTVAGGHTPALRGARLADAVELLRRLPDLPPADLLGQVDLDAMLAASRPDAA